MKKIFLFIFLFSPLFLIAQKDSSICDTLILDKFFHFAGRQIKKVFALEVQETKIGLSIMPQADWLSTNLRGVKFWEVLRF
jgi:hypothetical protein